MLHIHRAERADLLAEALGRALVEPLSDPFAPEVVCVHTRGMERWLSQRLSCCLGVRDGCGDGVCANIEFPFPQVLIADAVAAASGVASEEDCWPATRSVWPLLAVVEEHLGEP